MGNQNIQDKGQALTLSDIKPKLRFSKKILIAVGFVVLVIILSVSYYIFSSRLNPAPTSIQTASKPSQIPINETANWKTYKNTEHNYSIKYPVDKLVRVICPEEQLILIPRNTETQEEIEFETCDRDSRYSIEVTTDLIKSSHYKPTLEMMKYKEPNPNEYLKEKIIIGSKTPATKYSFVKSEKEDSPRPQWSVEIFAENKDKVYNFYLSNKNLEDIFNQILSTFEFTDYYSLEEIKEDKWTTYRDKEHGFELKVPSSFKKDTKSETLLYSGINILNLYNGETEHKPVKSNYLKANYLSINLYPNIDTYRLVDNPGGFVFYFNTNSRKWFHDKTNDTSNFTPKKTSNPIESYTYKTGDINCTDEHLLIPHPSYTYIIDIINSFCLDDNGNHLRGYYNLTSDQVLSTFKFLPASPSASQGGDKNETSDTSGWKTYTNEELGFSFSYPSFLTLTSSRNINYSGVLLSPPNFEFFPISLDYYDNPQNLSIKHFKAELQKNNDAGEPIGIVTEEEGQPINLSGNIVAYYNPGTYCVAVCGRYTWQYKSKIFVLTGPGYLKEYESEIPLGTKEGIKILSQIFNTFKFKE